MTPLTGAKEVCDRATCGACSMFVDDKLVYSCSMLAIEAQGKKITTVEGLGENGKLSKVQEAFVEQDALMCGYCTPGFVMSVTALLRKESKADRSRSAPCLLRQSLPLRHLSAHSSRRAQSRGCLQNRQNRSDFLCQVGLKNQPTSAPITRASMDRSKVTRRGEISVRRPARGLALRHDSALKMGEGENYENQSGSGPENSRHQSRRPRARGRASVRTAAATSRCAITARKSPASPERPSRPASTRLKAIEVEATELPFVVHEEDAKADDSPRVWDGHAESRQA